MLLHRLISQSRIPVVGMALALSVAPGVASLARAQAPEGKSLELKTIEPETRRDNPKARALFDEVSKAYKSLTSYSDKGEFVIAMNIGGKDQKQATPLKITLVRPNKLDIDTGQVRLTSDGTSLTTTVIPLKKYTTAPAPQKIAFETLREGPLGAVLFGGPTGVPMFVLLNLLTAPDPAAAIAQLGGSFQIVAAPGAAPADGTTAIMIELNKGRPGIVLKLDPATKLLTGIDLKIDPEQLKQAALAGQKVSIEKFGWNAGAVTTEVPKGQSFAFEAPKGFAKVDSLFEQQEEKHAIDAKVGKPAPNFTLTLLDGPGKTKTVTKAELAGKVVVIDFWATWCGPCMMELPEIQKLIDSYADSKKEVVVVALSEDSEPSELAAVRKLVEKTLGEKKINLTGNPVGQIGLDPSNSVGSAFQLEGYPTLIIMDGKGIVQSVHVGYNPEAPEPLHKSLAKEIGQLLEGKSLANPPAEGKGAAATDAKAKP
jgi:thiol-disulfide isomerase/thioredoxin